MPSNIKISNLPAVGGLPDSSDILPITTTGAGGALTTKSITVQNLLGSSATVNTGLAADLPATPSVGDIYLETDTGNLRWWGGSVWNTFNADSQLNPNFAAEQLGYSGGLFPNTNYNISVQPIMHFDANILDGVSNTNNPSNATPVVTWGDRSGQATDYTASAKVSTSTGLPEAQYQPTFYSGGDGSYVSFDGGDFLNIANSYSRASTSPFTMVQVGNADSSGSNYYMAPNVGSSYNSVQLGKFNNGLVYVRSATLATGKDYSTLNMLTVTRDSSNAVELFKDGNLSEGSVSNASGPFDFDSIGPSGSTKTTGRIYECMLFDSVLSSADLNKINQYLKNKYSSLPNLVVWT